MNSGIYCIENIVNHKKYIGKSKNVNIRKSYHFSKLNNNKHDNDYLQKAWNKYGENKFLFYIIDEYSPEELYEKEIYWISKLKTSNEKFGYNLTTGGDGFALGEKNPQFGRGLPEHLIGKGFKPGKESPMFGKKPKNSSSFYHGVSKIFQKEKYLSWRTRIRIKGKQITIGFFKTEPEAAYAYNDYIIKNNLPNPLNFIK